MILRETKINAAVNSNLIRGPLSVKKQSMKSNNKTTKLKKNLGNSQKAKSKRKVCFKIGNIRAKTGKLENYHNGPDLVQAL